jgi:Mn2+/Fe2+ NRAMP family transporter
MVSNTASKAPRQNKASLVARFFGRLGPGLITGASDDDPSGIATYSQAGAQLGFAISWTMLFSYASQEVEDIKNVRPRQPLVAKPRQGADALERIRLDTYIGMAFSNLIALAIIITTAATLHRSGVTNIQTSTQAAEALRPLAGALAFSIFTAGIVGTGLLSIPVLAGSAAYALGEARGWPTGLARRPLEAKAFYTAIALATLIGAALNFSPLNPIKALYWTAVINGVVAVPVMVMMMLITGQRAIMGEFVISGPLRIAGWAATVVMAAAVVGMCITTFL